MPHQPLQGGQGHPAAYHIRSKGVPHPMGVGMRDATPHAMMAEERAKPGCTHRLAALPAFQADEQSGRVGERTFQAQIVSENFEEIRRQRHDALLVPFAVDAQLAVGELQVFQLNHQDLTRAQTIEEHQAYESQIAIGAEASPELADFFGRERHDDSPILFKAEAPGYGRARPAVAERGSAGIAALEMRLAGGNLLPGVEAIATAHGA